MNRRLKIGTIMLVALIITSISSNTVFIASTPRINTVFLTSLVTGPPRFIAAFLQGTSINISNSLASLTNFTKPIQQGGVSAPAAMITSVPNSGFTPNQQLAQTNQNQQTGSNQTGQNMFNFRQAEPTQGVQNTFNAISNIPASQMSMISKGVYAKEDEGLKTVYIRITQDANWDAQIIDYNGQKIKILIPKQ